MSSILYPRISSLSRSFHSNHEMDELVLPCDRSSTDSIEEIEIISKELGGLKITRKHVRDREIYYYTMYDVHGY